MSVTSVQVGLSQVNTGRDSPQPTPGHPWPLFLAKDREKGTFEKHWVSIALHQLGAGTPNLPPQDQVGSRCLPWQKPMTVSFSPLRFGAGVPDGEGRSSRALSCPNTCSEELPPASPHWPQARHPEIAQNEDTGDPHTIPSGLESGAVPRRTTLGKDSRARQGQGSAHVSAWGRYFQLLKQREGPFSPLWMIPFDSAQSGS